MEKKKEDEFGHVWVFFQLEILCLQISVSLKKAKAEPSSSGQVLFLDPGVWDLQRDLCSTLWSNIGLSTHCLETLLGESERTLPLLTFEANRILFSVTRGKRKGPCVDSHRQYTNKQACLYISETLFMVTGTGIFYNFHFSQNITLLLIFFQPFTK